MEKRLAENAERIVEFSEEHAYLRKAFLHLFGERLMQDGYVDAGFILETYTRGTYYTQLKDSPLQKLYAKSCVPSESLDIMFGYMENMIDDGARLSSLEEEALVFWLFLPYLAWSKKSRKQSYLLEILKRFLEIWDGDGEEDADETDLEGGEGYPEEEGYLEEWSEGLQITHGVIYDSSLCRVEIIDSVESYASEAFALKSENDGKTLFYRGHSRLDYLLLPGIKREKSWQKNENTMYQELLVRCAQNFTHCQTHLDYLVEMQHYGLPTRLLDITENPLVALYFACCSNQNRLGEVILFCAETKSMKYAKSDTVAVLAALPTLSHEEQRTLLHLCRNGKNEEKDAEYKALAGKLAAEIKSRNPAFEPRIKKTDLLGHVFVTPIRNNQRIVKQDGSFIICGLSGKYRDSGALGSLRCKDKDGKTVVLVAQDKAKLMKELDMLSINQAGLFPEIDDVAQYLKEKYR